MDERLVDLEIRYTHQEALLAQLNEVLFRQQRTIDVLERRVADLEKRLSGQEEPIPNEKPPHY